VNSDDPDAVRAAFTPKTKAFYAESIANPKMNIADFEKLAAIAHAAGVPFVLDNTVTPYLLRPFAHGVDIAVYSLTKFIGGHGNSIGGAIVDSGNWKPTAERFPFLASPDPSYHGVNFVERFKERAFCAKARLSLLRDLGPALAPFNAFLFLQGLETLHVRMPRHAENALRVAQFLADNPHVSWVKYPGLAADAEYPKAQKYFPHGAGSIIGFGIQGGAPAGKRFINALELISHLANIGDAKTLAIHPATTTHQQLSADEQRAAGVSPDFIRLSVGIEHVDDIIADLTQALAKSTS